MSRSLLRWIHASDLQLHRQLSCVATVRLDPISGFNRGQRRCNDQAPHAQAIELPLQDVAAWSGLVTAHYLSHSLLQKLLGESPNCPRLVGQLPLQLLVPGDEAHNNPLLVDVHSYVGGKLVHDDRSPSYAALAPQGANPR